MDFFDIPAYPGYQISPRGEVRSPRGFILSVASRGQVRIKVKGKIRLEYIGDLLAQAIQLRPHQDAGQTADDMPADYSELKERIRLARKLNGHLLALVRRRQPETDVSRLQVEEL